MTEQEDSGLWRYALRAWRRPGIERACLALQDDFSVPVASLLFAGWASWRGYAPDAQLARLAMTQIEEWERLRLAPLRTVRRQASRMPAWSEWKRLLQDAELEGERLLLGTLEQLLAEAPRPGGEASALSTWLLLMVPQSAGCEGIGAALQVLEAGFELPPS